MDTTEILWVAGILEGEGSFIIKASGGLAVNCTMTDLDVVTRLHILVNGGTLIKENLRPNRKQAYSWRMGNRRQVIELITLLRPHMGARRRSKIDEMIEHDRLHPKQRQEKGAVAHGTRSMYSKYGCRCDPCKAAERAYKRPDAPRQYKRKVKSDVG